MQTWGHLHHLALRGHRGPGKHLSEVWLRVLCANRLSTFLLSLWDLLLLSDPSRTARPKPLTFPLHVLVGSLTEVFEVPHLLL